MRRVGYPAFVVRYPIVRRLKAQVLCECLVGNPNRDGHTRLLVGMHTVMATSGLADSAVGRLGDDVQSFYAAVMPHVDKMNRVAARLAGVDNRDDVVQDALLQAWRARGQFDPQRGTLSAWLLSITAHQATKVRRHFAVKLSLPTDAAANPDDTIDVRQAVSRLSPRERLAVDCFYFADLSIADTAAVMRCSEGTVKSTLSSARDRLREVLR